MPTNRLTSPNMAPVQAKYQDKSLIARFANRRFMETIRDMIASVSVQSILDAGCGEGEVLVQVFSNTPWTLTAMDIDVHRLKIAGKRATNAFLMLGSLDQLPFPNDSFDLVMSLEVLEHVDHPEKALQELWRVSRQYVLLSVPNEPWWRIGNMMRLKYVRAWGNTPEHINHWTYRGFMRLVSQRFAIIRTATPVLWTFVLGEKMRVIE